MPEQPAANRPDDEADGEEHRGVELLDDRVGARKERAGDLNALLNIWCGLLLVGVALWLVWELWTAVAPKPITDDFLKLLDQSFGRDWRRPRTWPWARLGWAYGFTLVGAASTLALVLLGSAAISSARPVKAPAAHVETAERFRQLP